MGKSFKYNNFEMAFLINNLIMALAVVSQEAHPELAGVPSLGVLQANPEVVPGLDVNPEVPEVTTTVAEDESSTHAKGKCCSELTAKLADLSAKLEYWTKNEKKKLESLE